MRLIHNVKGGKVLNRLEIIAIKEAKLLGNNIKNEQFNNDRHPLNKKKIVNGNLGT